PLERLDRQAEPFEAGRVAAGAPRREARGRDLEREPRLEDLARIVAGGGLVGGDRRLAVDDEGPAPGPGHDETARLELAERDADRRPADPEPRRELSLRRKPLADGEVAAADQHLELRRHGLVRVRRA